MPVEYRCLCVWGKFLRINNNITEPLSSSVSNCLRQASLVSRKAGWRPLRPGQTGLGWEWRKWVEPAPGPSHQSVRGEEWNSGWKVIFCEFYQVCTRGKVVSGSRNIIGSIPSPKIQMSWSFDLHRRVQSVTVMWLLLLLAVGGKAPCFTFLRAVVVLMCYPVFLFEIFNIPHDGDVTLTLLIAQLGFPMCRNSAPAHCHTLHTSRRVKSHITDITASHLHITQSE